MPAKAHWYLSRPREADIPQAHGKPTRAHRKPSLKAARSRKSREAGRLTLIVAKSPQDDLVVPWRATDVPSVMCVKEKPNVAH